MLRTKQLEQHTFDAKDPWSYILAQCAWAICSTVHLILDAMLAQLIFGHNMLFDLSYKVRWHDICQCHQQSIDDSNKRENSWWVQHHYQVGDQVLLDHNVLQCKLLPKHDGPFTIQCIYLNGIIKLSKGITTQKVSIPHITPYHLHEWHAMVTVSRVFYQKT